MLHLAAIRKEAAPSLLGYIKSRSGGSRTAAQTPSSGSQFWLSRLYDEGRVFSESTAKTVYNDKWLQSFAKYLFYRVAHGIMWFVLLALALLVKLIGINDWLQRVASRNRDQQLLEVGKALRDLEALAVQQTATEPAPEHDETRPVNSV